MIDTYKHKLYFDKAGVYDYTLPDYVDVVSITALGAGGGGIRMNVLGKENFAAGGRGSDNEEKHLYIGDLYSRRLKIEVGKAGVEEKLTAATTDDITWGSVQAADGGSSTCYLYFSGKDTDTDEPAKTINACGGGGASVYYDNDMDKGLSWGFGKYGTSTFSPSEDGTVIVEYEAPIIRKDVPDETLV